MDTGEENPTRAGPNGDDACRPVPDADAAELAMPPAPVAEQAQRGADFSAAEEVAHPEIEKAKDAAMVPEQLQAENPVQPADGQENPVEEAIKPDEAQQEAASPADEPLDVAISDAEFIKAADSQRVVWARVKGFPHWPAQILTEKEAAVRMEKVFRPSPLSVPVMFFGTLEIAWMTPSEVASWEDGVKANYLKKNKTRRKFLLSVEQAHAFLAPGPKRRKAPEGWWKKAINPLKPKPKETVLEIGALASDAQAAKPGASKGGKGGSKVANGLGVHTNSKVAKRVQRPVKRIDGADEDEIQALLGDEGDAPKRRGSAAGRHPAPKPPHYEAIRRNLWVSRQRPKRLPKDDIPVCGCTPPVAAFAPPQRPSTPAVPLVAHPPLDPPSGPAATPAVAAEPGSAPAPAASGPAGEAAAEQPMAASEGADAPVTSREPQPLPNGAVAPGDAEGTIAAEAHVPIAVPEPSAVLVPPAAVASAAKAAMPERTGCGENCLNRLSYIHCDPKQCPCGEYCSNRPFHLLPVPKTELFLTENRGWGVKAAEQIPRGTFIVEYAGEVIEDEECRRRMAEAKENGLQHFYMMELAPGLIIDARNKGNMARFINSSCAPNCESQKWHDAATGEIRIGIFAADDIKPGTELAYDYQFQHAGLAQDAGAYRCMCGAPNCRGTMDTQPERFKDFGKRVEVFWDGDSVYYRGTVTAYSTTTGKHTILYDDNDVERVCLKTVRHRWLDESAPMKLSPLHAALVAQSGLLGPEPLDLNAGPEPDMPQAPAPEVAQPEAQPPEQLADQPEVQPAESPIAETVEEAAGQAKAPDAANEAAAPAAAKQARPVRKVRAAVNGRGLKRKQAEETEGQLAQADRMDDGSPGAQAPHVPKHKMRLKRCQRESQEKDALLQQQPPAMNMPFLDPAAAAQLTANAGAPPPPPLQQLPAPFNAPPFAVPPFPLPPMPPGLPGQNPLQVAMYQMLLMTNPQLMQSHKPEGSAMLPPMSMASLQQMFAAFANAAAAAPMPGVGNPLPWPAGGMGTGPTLSQALPPMAPLQLGPLTPATGPGQLPPQPMTPNFWGMIPPGYAPQVPPVWPPPNGAPGSGAGLLTQSAAAAPASVEAHMQLPNGGAGEMPAAASTLGSAIGAIAAPTQLTPPSEPSAAPSAAAENGGQAPANGATAVPAAREQDEGAGSMVPDKSEAAGGGADKMSAADEAAPSIVEQPMLEAEDTAAPVAQQVAEEQGSGAEEEPAAEAPEVPAAEEAQAPEQVAAPVEELPKQAEPEEKATADSHAVPMAVDDVGAAPAEADTAPVARPAESDAGDTPIAGGEEPAAAAGAPQDSVPGDVQAQEAPDGQSQLAAEADTALRGNVREEATGTPGEGVPEQSKEQSQLAADASAALVGDVRGATASDSEPIPEAPPPTEPADTPFQPHCNGAAQPNMDPSSAEPGTQQSVEVSGKQQIPAAALPQLMPEALLQQQLFDPTAVLSNGFVSPAKLASQEGLVASVEKTLAVAAGAAVLPVDADADEAELWGSLLVDSPSPCKAPKAAWVQDPALWRANGSGPAPPPVGQ